MIDLLLLLACAGTHSSPSNGASPEATVRADTDADTTTGTDPTTDTTTDDTTGTDPTTDTTTDTTDDTTTDTEPDTGSDTGTSSSCPGSFAAPSGTTAAWAGTLECAFEWTELGADGEVSEWSSGGNRYYVELTIEDGGDGDFTGTGTTYTTDYDTVTLSGRVGSGGAAFGVCAVAELTGCIEVSEVDASTLQFSFYVEATNHAPCNVWCYGKVTNPPGVAPDWVP